MPSEKEVRAIKDRHSIRLLQQPGVCGVGVEKDAQGDFVLAVHLDAGKAGSEAEVPSSIEGTPVKIIRSGPFRAL